MNTWQVAVIGLGKIGLPLAVQFATKRLFVKGVDVSEEVVELTNSGLPHFDEAGIESLLAGAVASGHLVAGTSLVSAVEAADFVVVVVPLYVNSNGDPEFENIDRTIIEVGKSLRRGSTVIIETTVPIGTTRLRFTPLLEEASRLRAGMDFYVAFSPERVSSGNVFSNLRAYPKLVGGITPESTRKAAMLYESGFDFDFRTDLSRANGVWAMGSSESAEFAKLAETTFRDVNIALANTFAKHASELGVSYDEVREACNSQPFAMLHSPGISVGGHCIPVYPHMYLQSDTDATLVSVARGINKGAPVRAASVLEKSLGDLANRKVLVSGLAYRTGVKESAFSGGADLYEVLQNLGAKVNLVDELYSASDISEMGFLPNFGDEYDALLINSGTREFQLSLLGLLTESAVVLDGRSVLANSDWPNLIQIGEGTSSK